MEKHITSINSLSRFMQILDGSFPSGVFVHSFGLEPHIVLDIVKDIDSLKVYLDNLIKDQYQNFEFVYAKKVYKYLESNKLHVLIKEDKKYNAMLSYEYAKASCDMGRNYLRHINFDLKKTIVNDYFKEISQGVSSGSELLVLCAYAYELDLDIDLFLLLWCKKTLINIAATSIKISRIKPSQIQQLLFTYDEVLEDCIKNSSNNVSNFNPLFEEVIFKHLNLEPKMFVT